MEKISIRQFGSLDHKYPIIEVYDGNNLIIELITGDENYKVQAFVSDNSIIFDGPTLAKLLSYILPEWKQSLEARDAPVVK